MISPPRFRPDRRDPRAADGSRGLGLVALSTLAVVYLLLYAAINGAGHTFGYKSFQNDATNLRLLALITFGEGCTTTITPARPCRLNVLGKRQCGSCFR